MAFENARKDAEATFAARLGQSLEDVAVLGFGACGGLGEERKKLPWCTMT